MKHLVLFFLFFSFASFAQDTTNVYVINNTNRLARIDLDGKSTYILEFRNLKKLSEIAVIQFGKKEGVLKFFDTCEKVLNQDIKVVGEHYNVVRNKVDKNTVRIDTKGVAAYLLLKRETLDSMRSAMEKEAL
jgi:hypothetical protein